MHGQWQPKVTADLSELTMYYSVIAHHTYVGFREVKQLSKSHRACKW